MVLDADDIKEKMPDYVALKAQKVAGAAFQVHARSLVLRGALIYEAIKRKQCVILDGTGSHPKFWIAILDYLKKNNYSLGLIRVDIDLATARQRKQAREKIDGRVVPEEAFESSHAESLKALPDLQKNVDWFMRYDSNQTPAALVSPAVTI